MAAPHELERKLGHTFVDGSLLQQALTHRSFGTPNNERLEFLGDSVLNCAVADALYVRFPEMPEGDLSRLRANLVNQPMLAEIAGEIGVAAHLRLGDGEIKTGGNERPSILADSVEALLGAVFLDGGFAAANAVIRKLFEPKLDHARTVSYGKDGKTALQEWLQARHLALPKYEVSRIEGEPHRQQFEVRCEVGNMSGALNIVTTGHGSTRRMAEQAAAATALQELQQAASGKTSGKAL